MLKFLTHKLKTQSLNEDDQQFQNKAQDDHDSGTESDDESGEPNGSPGDNNVMDHGEDSDWGERGLYPLPRRGSFLQCNSDGPGAGEMMMVIGGGGRDSVSSQFDPGYPLADSALPSDSDHAYDHHSSEEELEVINSSSYDEVDDEVNLPDGDELLEDNSRRGGNENCKRKWSQMAANRLSVESTASSSDEEVQGLMRPLSTPVEFRTSPPVDAHKPSRSQSPPPKLFLFSGPTLPIVTSSTGQEGEGGDGGHNSENNSTAVAVSSPISSNVVSSTICSLGAVMGERSTGVFRGIRKFNPDNSTSLNNCNNPVIGGGAFERSDGSRSQLNAVNSNNSETTTTASNFINQLILTNSSFTSSSTGAFGRVTRYAGNGTASNNNKDSSSSVTTRKRRHHNSRTRERPCLDFEKMQQLKARSVTTWRSGGELSLYCS